MYNHSDCKWNQISSDDIFFSDDDVPKQLKNKMYMMRKFTRYMIERNTKKSQLVTGILWRGVRRQDETFVRFQMMLLLGDGKNEREILPHWYSREELNELEDDKMKAKILEADIKVWMFFDNTATDVSKTRHCSNQDDPRDDEKDGADEAHGPINGAKRNFQSSGDPVRDAAVKAQTAVLMAQLPPANP